uniref:Uncharacterized protein n=1 Tax=Rhizophora mucronata TaxID=61149 RepID=A0A2P2NCF2_RHIMU
MHIVISVYFLSHCCLLIF